ncbi:MAG: type IX secretion system membrane protein PorP/SprF [Bacteroidales bacterium]|nr:type IX secretion system membrane protein PorP/SprF [Bacteroidales bacterium]
MKYRKPILLVLLVLQKLTAFSQFYPVFSQYISNGLLINPAYTGSREVLSMNLLYRKQMLGFTGSPNYLVFSAHSPLKNPNIGLGILVFDEKTGPIHNSHLYLHYAFRIPTQQGRLSLGLKAGINYAQFNWKQIYLNDADDPAFSGDVQTFLMPNFGAGIYYYTSKAFAGFSIPYFLSYTEKNNYQSIKFQNDFKNYNFLLMGGYLFSFSRNFKFKPSILYKIYPQSQSQLDINSTFFLLDEQFNLTLAYRVNEAWVGALDFRINPQFRICYTYEYAGKIARFFNYTSHEIGLRYELMYKIRAANPRYF